MGGFIHIRAIVHHPRWCHNSLYIIQLVMMVVIHLLFHMVMVKVVWVLGPPKCSPQNNIFGLMVVILCHLWVDIIQLWSIWSKIGTMIYYIIKGRIILVLLVMVDVVLVERKHTSTPLELIYSETVMIGAWKEKGIFVAVLIFSDVPSATIHPIVPHVHWVGLVHIHLHQVPFLVSRPFRNVLNEKYLILWYFNINFLLD